MHDTRFARKVLNSASGDPVTSTSTVLDAALHLPTTREHYHVFLKQIPVFQPLLFIVDNRTQHTDKNADEMIKYYKITPNECQDVAKHMIDNFFHHEPFGLALGLTIDQVEPWYHKFLAELLDYYEPASFLARCTVTGEIVGVIINLIIDPSDSSRKPPPNMKRYLDKTKQPQKWQIATFLEDLEEGVDVVKALKLDESKPQKQLVCLFLSVASSHGGKGIAKTLIHESEKLALEHLDGVTIMMTETTSHFSFLAFQKLGYSCIKEVRYLDYKDPDGIPIFEGREKALGVHTHARIMAKHIV